MERELSGRVCVATGASSGIGETTARAFAAGGARVALLARRRERVDALAEELGETALPDRGRRPRPEPRLRLAAGGIRARLGRVDCLVNNAGMMLNSPFLAGLSTSGGRWWRRTCSACSMRHTSSSATSAPTAGDIVNLSSVPGRKARPATNVYEATKHAVTGWSGRAAGAARARRARDPR